MLSEQAKQVIAMMKSGWANRPAADPDKDPKLAAIEAVYAERAMVDNPNRIAKVPDKISVIPEMADGVYGEWLQYLNDAPDKIQDKVILFLHGGGFQTGSCLSRREMASNIGVRAKMDTFIINYRLAPEYKWPAGLMDCVTAFIWLLKKGYKPENITVIGESAGAAYTLTMCHYLRDHYLPLPGRICPFSPPADLLHKTDAWFTNLPNDAMLGRNASEEEIAELLEKAHNDELPFGNILFCTEEEAASPYVSPVRGSFKGFPKTLIEAGAYELLADDARWIYEKMTEEGVDVKLHMWDELFHVFALLPMPESDEVCEEIAAFARG